MEWERVPTRSIHWVRLEVRLKYGALVTTSCPNVCSRVSIGIVSLRPFLSFFTFHVVFRHRALILSYVRLVKARICDVPIPVSGSNSIGKQPPGDHRSETTMPPKREGVQASKRAVESNFNGLSTGEQLSVSMSAHSLILILDPRKRPKRINLDSRTLSAPIKLNLDNVARNQSVCAQRGCEQIERFLRPNGSAIALGQMGYWKGAMLYALNRIKASPPDPLKHDVRPSVILLLPHDDLASELRPVLEDIVGHSSNLRISYFGSGSYDQQLEEVRHQKPHVIVGTIDILQTALSAGVIKLSDLCYLLVSHADAFFDRTSAVGSSFQGCFCSSKWIRERWDMQVILLEESMQCWHPYTLKNAKAFTENEDILDLEGNFPIVLPNSSTSEIKPTAAVRFSSPIVDNATSNDSHPVIVNDDTISVDSNTTPRKGIETPCLTRPRSMLQASEVDILDSQHTESTGTNHNRAATAARNQDTAVVLADQKGLEAGVDLGGSEGHADPNRSEKDVAPESSELKMELNEDILTLENELVDIFRRIRIMRQLKAEGISWNEYQTVRTLLVSSEEGSVQETFSSEEVLLTREQLKDIIRKVWTLRELLKNGFTWEEYQTVTNQKH